MNAGFGSRAKRAIDRMAVEIVESRRLTGANVHSRAPGAVLELRCDPGIDPGFDLGFDLGELIGRWKQALAEGLTTLAWTAELHVRRFVDAGGREGAELMFSAAVDRLYAATELNEWALACALGQLDADSSGARLAEIAEAARAEQRDRMGALALIAAAEARAVTWLIDDDQLSLGQFGDAQIWPIHALPEVDAIDWSSFQRSPLALITGTNGKTTTTRLLTRMLRKHGRHVGNTSTDGLYVDERRVESGDWTGPGGARAILRNPSVEVALLEAARGGLLRRGVGVPRADVAVITNVAQDHLGEYGVFDLAGMAAAKGVVTSVVDASGSIVLGADSPALLEWARGQQLRAPITWFSLEVDNPVLVAALAAGAEVWTIVDGCIARRAGLGGGAATTLLCPVDAMPFGHGGRARHNVANALAAAAAARGLGVADQAISAALREFGSSAEDNPGRAHIGSVQGPSGPVQLLIDFAHNLEGLAAIAELARAYFGPTAPTVCFGMAGDRSDDELRTIAAALMEFEPSRVILREQPAYLRGRNPGEVPAVLEQGLIEAGLDPARISFAVDEPASIEHAIEAGAELVLLLVHTEREAVSRWLRAHGAGHGAGDESGLDGRS